MGVNSTLTWCYAPVILNFILFSPDSCLSGLFTYGFFFLECHKASVYWTPYLLFMPFHPSKFSQNEIRCRFLCKSRNTVYLSPTCYCLFNCIFYLNTGTVSTLLTDVSPLPDTVLDTMQVSHKQSLNEWAINYVSHSSSRQHSGILCHLLHQCPATLSAFR